MPAIAPAAVPDRFEEPEIPARLRRPLAALWVSIALHAAIIAVVQVAAPRPGAPPAAVLEARLVTTQARPEKHSEPVPPRLESRTVAGAVPSEPVEAVQPTEPSVPEREATPREASLEEDSDGDERVAPTPPDGPMTLNSGVDLYYYSARELDVQPRALEQVEALYPPEADAAHQSGWVRLQLKVEADGRVLDADVLAAEPPGVFDAAAKSAFETMRFAPALKAGRPVRARMVIEVRFDWAGRLGPPSDALP